MKSHPGIRFALLAIILLVPFGREAPAQIDFGSVVDAIQNPDDYEFDPSQVPALAGADWNLLWTELDRALQSQSLEELVWIRPYAELALVQLEGSAETAPVADWLRQKIDYLWMAEEVLNEERAKTPAPPPVAPPAKPATVKPPPHKPAPPTPTGTAKKTMDIERWTKRIESRPAPKGAATYVPLLKPIFRKHGVPEPLIWLAEVESTFDPDAKSPVGARGLFQFMPATAERFGLSLNPRDQRRDPEKSAEAAAEYLKFLHGRFDSWPLALAAYNAGEGRVGKLLKQHNATSFEGIADHLPAETRMYVPKISAVIKVREGVELRSLDSAQTYLFPMSLFPDKFAGL